MYAIDRMARDTCEYDQGLESTLGVIKDLIPLSFGSRVINLIIYKTGNL